MHGEGSSQRKDKVFFLLEGVSHCKGFMVILKQNVGEMFHGEMGEACVEVRKSFRKREDNDSAGRARPFVGLFLIVPAF